MRTLSISERYRPAFLSVGKEWMVVYWVLHPDTGLMKRFKEKLNHIRDEQTRKKYGQQRIRELNGKLAIGWNPIMDSKAPRSATPIEQALADFMATKVAEGIADDSVRSYRSLCRILKDWLQAVGRLQASVGTFGEEDALQFMDHCFQRRAISRRTFNNYKTFYSTLCLWWVKRKYITANPFAGVERKKFDLRKKNRRPFTQAERALVREYLANENPRFLTFSLIMFHCALRPKEVYHLKSKHFDLKNQCIHVDADFSKNNYYRAAAIPDVLLPDIKSLGVDLVHPGHYVFSTNFKPGPIRKSSRDSGRAWAQVRDHLRLPPDLKHYSLRDTAAMQLSADGISRVDAMNHFDHHSSDIHDMYTRHAEHGGNESVKRRATAF